MPLNLINTFLVQSKVRREPQILLSLSTPSKNRLGLGRLVSLASVNDSKRRGLKYKTQIYLSQILKYYEDLPEILGLTPKKIAAQKGRLNLFEKTLERANFLAPQTFGGAELVDINIVLANLSDDNLELAGRGRFSGHLLYEENEKQKALNLLGEYNQQTETGEPLFGKLISGNVADDGFFVLSLGDAFDYLSVNRLHKIMAQSGPEEACLFLEKSLSQLSSNSFGGIIASWPKKAPAPKTIVLREFRLLSDIAIKKLIQQRHPSLWEKIPPAAAAAIRGVTAQGRDALEKLRLLAVKQAAKLNRKIILAATALLLIFIFGLVLKQRQERKRVENERYAVLVNEIQKIFDEAESNLIYKNEKRARELITQAAQLLTELPQNSAEHRSAFELEKQKLSLLSDRVNNLRQESSRPIKKQGN